VEQLAKISKRDVAESLLDEKGAGHILGHE